MVNLFLAVLVTVIIEDDVNSDVTYKAYYNSEQIYEGREKSFQYDLNLDQQGKLEATASTATHESERVGVSVGKPQAPSRVKVLLD